MTDRLALTVISHTPHHRTSGGLVGWGPTVTELSHLAALFDEVIHVAPVDDGPAPASALPYTAPNITVMPVRPAGGAGLGAKLGLVARLPGYLLALRRGLAGADVVHVRCPANLSGLALAWLRLTRDRRPCWVKYAGNWRPDGPDPWSYRRQRRWLQRGFGRLAVTVNGEWADTPAHVRAFDNPSLTEAELAAGRTAAGAKGAIDPLALAFVGRVEAAKGALDAVLIADGLIGQGIPTGLTIVGDGPALDECTALARARDIPLDAPGWLDRRGVQDVLGASHVVVLPSRTEGWPKVLSEAMAFGAIPVAPPISAIPQTFAETGAGVVTEGPEVDAFVRAIAPLASAPGRLDALRSAGLAAAGRFSFGTYREAVTDLFSDQWGLTLEDPP